jgi:hypothetical protein
MHSLWPTDYSPLVIMRVLAECKWGEAAGGDRKSQMEAVKRFFNEVSRENSGRAVRGEQPLEYEQCRARWTKLLEASYPQLGVLSSGASSGGAAGGRPGVGGRGAGAKNNGGFGAKSGGGLKTPPARMNRVPVCFNFNQAGGCTGRDRQGPHACKDKKGNVYSHYCNWWDVKSGKHCLKPHPRVSNH